MVKQTHLPLARASSGGLRMPDASAIKKLFEVSTNLEVAEYFRDQLAFQAKSCGLTDEFKDVMTEVDKFVNIIRTETPTNSNYWSGKAKDAAVSLYKVFHQNVSKKALDELEKQFPGTNIRFDFAMDATSDLVQGFFTPDGQALDDVQVSQMNAVYSDWLVGQNLACDNGVIFETDNDGAFIENDKGERKRVDPKKYIDLIMNEEKGFAAYIKKTTSKVTLSVNDVSASVYPEKKASQAID